MIKGNNTFTADEDAIILAEYRAKEHGYATRSRLRILSETGKQRSLSQISMRRSWLMSALNGDDELRAAQEKVIEHLRSIYPDIMSMSCDKAFALQRRALFSLIKDGSARCLVDIRPDASGVSHAVYA